MCPDGSVEANTNWNLKIGDIVSFLTSKDFVYTQTIDAYWYVGKQINNRIRIAYMKARFLEQDQFVFGKEYVFMAVP